jgi:hypothetical protein
MMQLDNITFSHYSDFSEIARITPMIDQELSEPYSIYTYRYFLTGWPELCIYAKLGEEIVGVPPSSKQPGHHRQTRDPPEESTQSRLYRHDCCG